MRVEWTVSSYTVGRKNAAFTTKHCGISRKIFHKWFNRIEGCKYDVRNLADQSKEPHHKRKWKIALAQAERIRRLRSRHPYYGKKKLKVLYENECSEEISTWKIERVIRRYKLYPDKRKAGKTARKRARALQKPKKRNCELDNIKNSEYDNSHSYIYLARNDKSAM